MPYERLTTSATGEPCITTGWRAETSDTPDDVAPSEVPNPGNVQGAGGWDNTYSAYPPCPPGTVVAGEDAPEGERTEPVSPALIAARYWEEIPLPKPAPQIAPGWAITGKLAYIETNGETRHVYGNATPLGPLEITATGQYFVDWGNGETTGPYAMEGKPWPDGQITYEYQRVGTYDVVVTERWTATWSLGGQNGTLRELRTVGRIDDFPVRQVQAVIR